MPVRLTPEQDRAAVNIVRGLAMDAPLRAKSGHQGTAMALAPLGHVLYSRVLRFDPADPAWVDRDRFVLSNGHASILQYALLFLNGIGGLELDDLQAFRQWESATPGHPEAGHPIGVEVTTGTLGQGFANAVGMAIAERFLRARFGADVVDHHTWVVTGDGCLMEGISHEAASLAGHLRLGRLIAVFDDNKITIDGNTNLTCSDDVVARFGAYGWAVRELGEIGEDLDALEAALVAARDDDDERPKLLVLRTHIAVPSPDHTDRHEAHGNPFTAEDVSRTKAVMGIPDEPFWAPPDVVAAVRTVAADRGAAAREAWAKRLAERGEQPVWQACWHGGTLPGWDADLPRFGPDDRLATRQAIQRALDAALAGVPGLLVGAADLTSNTGTKLAHQVPQSATDPEGRQIHFGVREHAMAGALVGMALHGGVYPVGGTFLVFFDYMKPAVRMAALSGAKCLFVFSHDSVGVGEDGPTHQPIEHLAALRSIPGLQVIRPADGNETVAALQAALAHEGPTALVLSRQALPTVTDGSAVATGASIVHEPDQPVQVVVLATGSEVGPCLEAASRLAGEGIGARVVSMPSWDRFAAQPAGWRETILPPGVPVLSVEAGSTFGWHRWADDCIGIDRFGASAPGEVVLARLGIEPDHIARRAAALVQRSSSSANGALS